MYADFDDVTMEGESLYWFRLDAPNGQSTEYSSVIGNYAEHIGRIFKKVAHFAMWCNVHFAGLFVWLFFLEYGSNLHVRQ